MRAIVSTDSVFQYTELPDPVPGPGQVRIQLEAAGVNPADRLIRSGIPGMEGVGVVEAQGPGVTTPRLGERVLVLAPQGCYAERLVMDARHVAPLPEFLAPTLAAALPLDFCTAHLILTDLTPVEPGEFVLVLGAGSALGSAAVQVASTLGGQVLATVHSPRQAALVRELGAELTVFPSEVVPMVNAYTRREGVNLILDGVGGNEGTRCLDVLASFGRLVMFGGRDPDYPAVRLMLRSQSLQGFNLGSYLQERPEKAASSLLEVLTWAASGRVTPLVGAEYPLSRATEAHAALGHPETLGKLVLRPELDAVGVGAGTFWEGTAE